MLAIKKVSDMSDKLRPLAKNISTNFYFVAFDFFVFYFEPSEISSETSLTLDGLKNIYQKSDQSFIDGITSQIQLKPISFEDSLRPVRDFFSFRGDSENPRVIEDQDASFCKENFDFFCKTIFEGLHRNNDLQVFRVYAPLGTSLGFAEPWGFCLIFIKPKDGLGALVSAQANF